MSVVHAYIPSPGQADAAARAAAVGMPLAAASLADDPRYAGLIGSVPCVVCDHDYEIVITPEPTTFAAVAAAHDALTARGADPGRIGTRQLIAGCPKAAPHADDLAVSQYSVSVNEAGGLLIITVKYSDGTVKTGSVALT